MKNTTYLTKLDKRLFRIYYPMGQNFDLNALAAEFVKKGFSVVEKELNLLKNKTDSKLNDLTKAVLGGEKPFTELVEAEFTQVVEEIKRELSAAASAPQPPALIKSATGGIVFDAIPANINNSFSGPIENDPTQYVINKANETDRFDLVYDKKKIVKLNDVMQKSTEYSLTDRYVQDQTTSGSFQNMEQNPELFKIYSTQAFMGIDKIMFGTSRFRFFDSSDYHKQLQVTYSYLLTADNNPTVFLSGTHPTMFEETLDYGILVPPSQSIKVTFVPHNFQPTFNALPENFDISEASDASYRSAVSWVGGVVPAMLARSGAAKNMMDRELKSPSSIAFFVLVIRSLQLSLKALNEYDNLTIQSNSSFDDTKFNVEYIDSTASDSGKQMEDIPKSDAFENYTYIRDDESTTSMEIVVAFIVLYYNNCMPFHVVSNASGESQNYKYHRSCFDFGIYPKKTSIVILTGRKAVWESMFTTNNVRQWMQSSTNLDSLLAYIYKEIPIKEDVLEIDALMSHISLLTDYSKLKLSPIRLGSPKLPYTLGFLNKASSFVEGIKYLDVYVRTLDILTYIKKTEVQAVMVDMYQAYLDETTFTNSAPAIMYQTIYQTFTSRLLIAFSMDSGLDRIWRVIFGYQEGKIWSTYLTEVFRKYFNANIFWDEKDGVLVNKFKEIPTIAYKGMLRSFDCSRSISTQSNMKRAVMNSVGFAYTPTLTQAIFENLIFSKYSSSLGALTQLDNTITLRYKTDYYILNNPRGTYSALSIGKKALEHNGLRVFEAVMSEKNWSESNVGTSNAGSTKFSSYADGPNISGTNLGLVEFQTSTGTIAEVQIVQEALTKVKERIVSQGLPRKVLEDLSRFLVQTRVYFGETQIIMTKKNVNINIVDDKLKLAQEHLEDIFGKEMKFCTINEQKIETSMKKITVLGTIHIFVDEKDYKPGNNESNSFSQLLGPNVDTLTISYEEEMLQYDKQKMEELFKDFKNGKLLVYDMASNNPANKNECLLMSYSMAISKLYKKPITVENLKNKYRSKFKKDYELMSSGIMHLNMLSDMYNTKCYVINMKEQEVELYGNGKNNLIFVTNEAHICWAKYKYDQDDVLFLNKLSKQDKMYRPQNGDSFVEYILASPLDDMDKSETLNELHRFLNSTRFAPQQKTQIVIRWLSNNNYRNYKLGEFINKLNKK